MIDSVPLIQNPNDAQQINASIIALKKASRELDEKIAQFNKLLSQEITNREKAITEAINSLDVPSVGGSGKYISAISEADGKISATESEITSTVSSGNSQPVTSGGVASELEKYPTFISTTMTDANQCVLNHPTLNRVYFYAGNFTTNVPRNTWAIVRCYQYGGGIVQFIDYTLATITETYRRYIRYDGQYPSAWEKIIRSSDVVDTVASGNGSPVTSNAVATNLESYLKCVKAYSVTSSTLDISDLPRGLYLCVFNNLYSSYERFNIGILCNWIMSQNAIKYTTIANDGITVSVNGSIITTNQVRIYGARFYRIGYARGTSDS